MAARFELFDHTADVGVRAFAPTREELIAPCTEGLYAVIGDLAVAGPGDAHEIVIHGDDPAVLLRDYLGEVLYLFDHELRRLDDLTVREFSDVQLVVSATSLQVDPARCRLEREVKAVTYHELALRPTTEGFEATYIVDI